MIDSKSRSDILLEEKIAQIDDKNFDKVFGVEEFATKQINRFENDVVVNLNNVSKENFTDHTSKPLFEIEIFPNEFLDNHIWEKNEQTQIKSKFFVSNKPLFFTFTSIAILLCILFIYNVFVINSLEQSVAVSLQSTASVNVVVESEENNFIMFENSSQIEIKNNNQNFNFEKEGVTETSNWFDNLCNFICQFFGG